MGAKATFVANRKLKPGESGLAGPHVLFERETLPGTYWLKQEPRAETHFLDPIWAILEKSSVVPGDPTLVDGQGEP